MVLVQRETQLQQLHTAFDDCRELRNGRVCLVTGAVGSGKTALLEEFSDYVTGNSGRLLSAVGSHAERGLQFGVVDQLVDSGGLDRVPAGRAGPAVRQAAFGALPEEPDGVPVGPVDEHTFASVMHTLFTSLLDLAAPVPLVLTVDDVHHADVTSLRCLLYAIRRLRCKRMLVVLTESDTIRCPNPMFRAELLSQPHLSRIGLPPLSADVDTVTRMAGPKLPPESVRKVAQQASAMAGGNPLLVRALIDEAASDGLGATGGPAARGGETFDQAVVRCLYRHEPEVRQAAQALAVLRRPCTPHVLGRLLGQATESAAQTMRLLRMSGLVDDDRLRHPRIAGILAADLPAEERRRLHRRAAEVLHEHGVEPFVAAEHLVRADWAEPPWAVPTLREAARQALTAGRLDTVGACLRLAERNAPGDHPALTCLGDGRATVRLLQEHLDDERAGGDCSPGAALRILASLVTPERDRLPAPHPAAALPRPGIAAAAPAADPEAPTPLSPTRGAHPFAADPSSRPRTESRSDTGPAEPRYDRRPDPHPRKHRRKRKERHRASGGLSQAEHRVAALAALGHTNREISGKLFITVSTVEQHLTRVYRKLEIKDRADLAARLPPRDPGSRQFDP